MKAWSQDVRRSEVLETLTSYGAVPDDRQAAFIAQLSDRSLLSTRHEFGEVARLVELALARLKA